MLSVGILLPNLIINGQYAAPTGLRGCVGVGGKRAQALRPYKIRVGKVVKLLNLVPMGQHVCCPYRNARLWGSQENRQHDGDLLIKMVVAGCAASG